MTARLFTVGEVLCVFLSMDALPLADATAFRRIVAGSESNVAAGFVRLGHRSSLVTTVGRDALGDAVESSLMSWGIDARVARADNPTGTLVRAPASQSDVEVVHLRTNSAATMIGPDDVNRAWQDDTDVVFVTGITAVRSASARAAVELTVARARQAGALVVCDPNLRTRLASAEQFESALLPLRGLVDVAIGDERELGLLAGTEPELAVTALLELGTRLVVVKHGAAGAWATDGRTEHRSMSRATRVVDTIGAGDAFAAGLIAGVVERADLRESLELASAVAAAVVSTPGDVEGFPRHRPAIEHQTEGADR